MKNWKLLVTHAAFDLFQLIWLQMESVILKKRKWIFVADKHLDL